MTRADELRHAAWYLRFIAERAVKRGRTAEEVAPMLARANELETCAANGIDPVRTVQR